MLKRLVIIGTAAVFTASCGDGASPLAAEAVARLAPADRPVAAVLVDLEKGQRDGDVQLLCSNVYDREDVGSPQQCQRLLDELKRGNSDLTVEPTTVSRKGKEAVVTARVNGALPDQQSAQIQTFELRQQPAGWRVRLRL